MLGGVTGGEWAERAVGIDMAESNRNPGFDTFRGQLLGPKQSFSGNQFLPIESESELFVWTYFWFGCKSERTRKIINWGGVTGGEWAERAVGLDMAESNEPC